MFRAVLCVVLMAACSGQAAAIDIWLSTSSTLTAPPANLASVPTLHNFVSQGTGSVFVWARPDTGKILQRWSLRLTSSDSNILSFDSSSIEDYTLIDDLDDADPTNDIYRWEFVFEPTGDPSEVDLFGFNISSPTPDRIAEGIGPSCNVKDEFCGTAGDTDDSWLLAKINYTLSANIGQTDLFFQIGSAGINHEGEATSAATVTFGDLSDGSLNGVTDRLTHGNNSNADALIVVHADPDADFDSDGDVDGLEFLTWQRGFGTGTTKAQGDATSDAAVDDIDLAALEFQYGAGVGPLGAWKSVTVPEPASGALAGCMLWVVLAGRRTARGVRRLNCRGGN